MNAPSPPPSFAEVLRAAVSASDLSLATLSERLAESGHRVSRSSLSAWQSGGSLPTRRSARAALPDLERLLGLPRGRLASAVEAAPAPEPPLLQPEVRPPWARSAAARQLLAQLETHPDDPAMPERLSLRFRVHVDDSGCQELMHFSHLLRGGAVPADRLVPIVRITDLPALPSFPLVYGATLGRLRTRPRLGLVAFELLFDEPLEPGEETLVEYVLPMPTPSPTQWIRTEVSPGLRELTLQACFSEAAAPDRVRFTAATGGTTPATTTITGEAGSFQSVVLDPEPGGYGLEWSWP